MPLNELSKFEPVEYLSAVRRGQAGQFLARGSRNAMVEGAGRVRAFRGPKILAGKSGSRIFFNANQKFAGLGTHAAVGTGSVFAVRKLLMAIGQGQVRFDGADLAGFIASSTLSYVKQSGGGYGATVFQAGRAQPSAPLIFAKNNPSAGQTPMSGGVSVCIWRASSIDGQVSLASLPSNVLTLSNQSVIVSFDGISVDANGQDVWGIGVPKLGFDDIGFFLELPTALGGETLESALATIDGVPRAVEVSWSNGALEGQDFAPSKAFPPAAGQFAGNLNDTLFLDADSIIYVGEPGYIGSFAPSNALFASEPAVHYLRIGAGAYARLGKHSVGILSYVGGAPALEYDEVLTGVGVSLPQNAALGYGGRLLMWLGSPCSFDGSLQPDLEYASKVLPDFAGWSAGQSAAKPIVAGFDPVGLYEVWAFGKTVMAKHAPTGRWCAPADLTGKVIGDVVGAVNLRRAADDKLVLCLACMDGSGISLYEYDAETGGAGSRMVVVTDDTAPSYGDTVSGVNVQAQTDDPDTNVLVELLVNYADAETIFDGTIAGGVPANIRARPNLLNVENHAFRVTVPCKGGYADVGLMEATGTRQGVFLS